MTDPVESTPQSQETPVAGASPAGSPEAVGEALPEYEELTPELVEDECLRGDVMLRWGALLLALLLSFTYITETQVLVEIRSGEYLASHGILPPRLDPFSTAAADRPWVNLGWFSQLLLGIAHRGGLAAVTIFGVATVCVGFYFLNQTKTSGVTTWWGSICTGLAAIALFPVLQPGTMSVTVAGLGVLLWLIQRWRENPATNANWQLPVLFLVWGNMDPNAYLGLIVLLGYCLGTLLTGAPERKNPGADPGLRMLWIQAGLCVLAIMVHPWHWHTLESGWVQLTLVPKEIRAYNGISEFLPQAGVSYLDTAYWQSIDPFDLATLLLTALAFLLQAFNLVRFDGGLCLAWIAALACGGFSSAAFTYSAVVSAVVASLAGQEWYRANFSMAYTVKSLSVLYSRLGRAVTVLAGFAVAYLAVNGSLMGPAGRRLGMGLDPRWDKRINSLEKIAAAGAYDDRPFPFRLDQGDLMLWLGQKPFVDSRLSLFVTGPENLLELHRGLREAILGFERKAPDGQPLNVKEILDKHEITQLVTRLWGPNPPYDNFVGLINRPDDWVMTGIGAAGATFTRTNTGKAEVDQFIADHNAMRFVEQAFRSGAESVSSERFDVPKSVGSYDRWLYQPLPELTAEVEEASHYLRLAVEASRAGNPQQTTALAVLAARQARRGLVKNPNQVEGWRILGQAQTVLLSIETQLSQLPPPNSTMRSNAVLSATANAVRAGQDNPNDLEQLATMHLQAQRADAALAVLERLERSQGGRLTRLPDSDPAAEEDEKNQRELVQQLTDAVEQARKAVADATAQKKELSELASLAVQSGCPLLAIELIEQDLTSISSNAPASLLYGGLLLEVGRTDDAWQYLEGLEKILPAPPLPPQAVPLMLEWYRLTAVANYAVGNLDRADELVQKSSEIRNSIALSGLMQQPFAVTMSQGEHGAWPMITTGFMMSAAVDFPEFWAGQQFQRAAAKIDAGQVQQATKLLRELLERHPAWSQRLLAVYYLTLLTGEEIPLEAPSQDIPIPPDLFGPEEPAALQEAASPEKTPQSTAPAESAKPETTSEPTEKPAPESNEAAAPQEPSSPK